MTKTLLLQGYGHSGVSFLRDFFKEIANSYVFDEEFDLLRKSGGLFELYTILLQNNPFLDDCIIRRFDRFTQYLAYERNWCKVLGSRFLELSRGLIDDLVFHKIEFNNRGFSVQEMVKFPKDTFGIHGTFKRKTRELNDEKDIYIIKAIDSDNLKTRINKYLEDVLNLFPACQYLALVHPLQISSCISTQLDYFQTPRTIIISRDPRDVYIESPLIKDVHDFIQYFLKWRKFEKQNRQLDILNIKFEDFIFDYEMTENSILVYCGIEPSEHSARKKLSNPSLSAKNVGLYKNFGDQAAITRIERELAAYCYNV